MKKLEKQTIFILMGAIIITAVLSILLTKSYEKYKTQKLISNYNNVTENIGINAIQKVDYTLPEFSITVMGSYVGNITNEDLKNLDVYGMYVTMTNGDTKTLKKCVGIKVKDILSLKQFTDYNNIIFKSDSGLQVSYTKDQINDNVFLIFTKNDDSVRDEKVAVLGVDRLSRYSIPNILRIDFN